MIKTSDVIIHGASSNAIPVPIIGESVSPSKIVPVYIDKNNTPHKCRALYIYDDIKCYFMDVISTNALSTYDLSGACAPISATVNIGSWYDVVNSDYKQMFDGSAAIASVTSDENGEFSFTNIQGMSGNLVVWIAVSPEYASTGNIYCDIIGMYTDEEIPESASIAYAAFDSVEEYEQCPNCNGYGYISDGTVTCDYCLATGHEPAEDGSADIYMKCTECHGYRYVVCETCEGEGRLYESCYNCNNTGEQTCMSCNGEAVQPCLVCNGTGHNSQLSSEPCHLCNGAGSICPACGNTANDNVACTNCGAAVEICSHCDGNGYEFEPCYYCNGIGSTPCFTCNGTGKHECIICGGSCRIEVGNCYNCAGTGLLGTGSYPRVCSHCSGSGYEPCSHCGGSSWELNVLCQPCEGTGQYLNSEYKYETRVSGTCPTDAGLIRISACANTEEDFTAEQLNDTLVATSESYDSSYELTGSFGRKDVKYVVWCYTNTSESVTVETEFITSMINSCLSGDTMISMADGSVKQMQDVVEGDLVISQNGQPVRVYHTARGHFNDHHIYYYFEDGTIINETHDHRFYNVEQGFWQRLKHWNVGEHAIGQNGELIALIRKELVAEPAEMFGIWTHDGMYFANGLLSGAALCNKHLLENATAEEAVDMILSAEEEKLLKLIGLERLVP